MRIIVFSNSYAPTIGGLEISIALFRRALLEAGHEVYVVAPAHDHFEDEEPYVFRVPALELPGEADIALPVPRRAPIEVTVRGLKPDLIHSQHPMLLGELAAGFAEDLGVPLLLTFHTRYVEYARHYVPFAAGLVDGVTREMVARYLERCSHIIAPTASIRDFIQSEYAPQAPVSVVPTPVDLSAYRDLDPGRVRAAHGLQGSELLLYVGRLAAEKNLDFLLDAFARVAQQRLQARLVLVGGGPEEGSLRSTVQAMGLADRVVFAGAVPHGEVPHYAAAADLFVFASQTETQGMVLIEAMAAGAPVVAVEATGSSDMLADGGGVLVPADVEAFAAAVVDLLSDTRRRHALREEAARVAQGYGVPEVTARLLDVYEAAIRQGRSTDGQD